MLWAGAYSPARVCFPYRLCSDSKCSSCKKFKPFAAWDFHELCPACRECTSSSPCQVCRGWSAREWDLIRQRSEERGKAIPKKKRSSKSSKASSSKFSSHGSSHSRSQWKKKKSVSGSAPANPTEEAIRTGLGSARPGPTVQSSMENASEIGGSTAWTGLPYLSSDVQPETGGNAANPALPSLPASNLTETETQSGNHDNRQPEPVACATIPVDNQNSASNVDPSHLQLVPSSGIPAQDPGEDIELSFSSDLRSALTRDFEGFLERSRSTHRSKSRSKKQRRRRRSSSSSSSSSHHCRRRRRPDSSLPTEALSQLVALLSQSVERLPASNDPGPTHPQSGPAEVDPESALENPDIIADSSSDREQETPNTYVPRYRNDRSFSDDASDDSDDDPILGTMFSRDAFGKAVDVIRKQLGFDPPPPPESTSSKRSKLSLNKPSTPSRSVMPVGVECFDRFETQANSKKWRAFPKRQSTDFHISDQDYKAFFASPTIPESCLDKLKASGSVDHKGFFRSPATKKSFLSLQNIDLAARTGMKFASSLLFFAEVLSKSFRQPGT